MKQAESLLLQNPACFSGLCPDRSRLRVGVGKFGRSASSIQPPTRSRCLRRWSRLKACCLKNPSLLQQASSH